MKTKYCLKSTSTFNQINKSQTNRSRSKQTFSFSKSQRFQTIEPYCQKNTYNKEIIQRKNSGISIGNGKRYDFTKSPTISPGVSKYNLKTIFNQQQTRKKGYSLRLSRDQVGFGNYLNKQLISVPAPTKYNNQKNQRTKSPSFTLRARTRILDKSKTLQSQNNNPGPGYYENPQMKENSKYSSKFSNIGYSSSKSKRFGSFDNNVPGPGNYKQISALSKIGKYVVSNHTGGTKAIFDHQKRISTFDRIKFQSKEKPGPGYYKMPSEFGQYDGDIYQDSKAIHTSRYSRRINSKND